MCLIYSRMVMKKSQLASLRKSRFTVLQVPGSLNFIVGILVLAIWLLTIRNIIHSTSDDWFLYIVIAAVGTLFSVQNLCHSYHPTAIDLPFVKIVNARQVYYLSLSSRFASVGLSLLFLWISCSDLIDNEDLFFGGMVACCVLLCLNGVFFY